MIVLKHFEVSCDGYILCNVGRINTRVKIYLKNK